MKTERELFDKERELFEVEYTKAAPFWVNYALWDSDKLSYTLDEEKCINSNLTDDQFYLILGCLISGWTMWQASAQREGYKLVPVEPPEDMDIKICRLVDHRIDVFEADRIYKAMIGAAP